MPKFKVGEIAILALEAAKTDADVMQHNGKEVEIEAVGSPIELLLERKADVQLYTVTWPNGQLGQVRETSLRKRPSDRDLSSWEEVKKDTNWSPKELTKI